MYVCMCICLYVCMHACMYVCMYVYMYVCMYAYMYVCMNRQMVEKINSVVLQACSNVIYSRNRLLNWWLILQTLFFWFLILFYHQEWNFEASNCSMDKNKYREPQCWGYNSSKVIKINGVVGNDGNCQSS